jgi:fluoroquinolone resistance protein
LPENQIFEKIDFTGTNLALNEYDNCKFINCKLNGTDLSDFTFNGCEFNNCDLSLAGLKNTGFDDIRFKNCKLQGLHFDDCNDFLFSVYFENCILNISSFFKMKLKKTVFRNCNLQETDFSESELIGATFDNCDLLRTVFHNTNLESVDFYSSFNYSFDPEFNRLKKTRFSRGGVIGLLDKYDIKIED